MSIAILTIIASTFRMLECGARMEATDPVVTCAWISKSDCETSGKTCVKDSRGCWVRQQSSGGNCVGHYATQEACYQGHPSSQWNCVLCKDNQKYAAVAKTPTYYPPVTDTNEVATVIKYYTIIYKLNGGKFINGSTEDRTTYVAENQVIGEFKTNPIKDGYKFKEWQLNGSKFDFTQKPTANITLEAVYEKLTDDDKKYYCEDGYILDSSTNMCYKVLKPDNTNTFDYTKYSYAAGQTFCYAYSASANRAGGVNPKSGINATTTGKNNVTYDGYDSQDAWVSKDTCKFGTECRELSSTTRQACETIWSAIIFSKKEAEISVSFDKKLTVDVGKSIIQGISSGTKLSSISSSLTTIKSKTLLDKSGNTISQTTASAKTGDKVKVQLANDEYIEYKLSVRGDSSGDGNVDITDLIQVSKEVVKHDVLKDEYYIAADVNGDDVVNITDVVKVAKNIVKNESL